MFNYFNLKEGIQTKLLDKRPDSYHNKTLKDMVDIHAASITKLYSYASRIGNRLKICCEHKNERIRKLFDTNINRCFFTYSIFSIKVKVSF